MPADVAVCSITQAIQALFDDAIKVLIREFPSGPRNQSGQITRAGAGSRTLDLRITGAFSAISPGNHRCGLVRSTGITQRHESNMLQNLPRIQLADACLRCTVVICTTIVVQMKPKDVFDREREWSALESFVDDSDRQALLGVVLGRRRVGKTFLLRRIAKQYGGFYHVFPARTAAKEHLDQLGAAVAKWRKLRVPLAYPDWQSACEDLFFLAKDGNATPIILDEVSYVLDSVPEFASLLQNAFDTVRDDPEAPPSRVILCGSALSTMEALADSTGPLAGRCSLRLDVHPFDHISDASFWDLADDPGRAFTIYAALGGIPAYRTLLKVDIPVEGETPSRWVSRELMAPDRAIFTEARDLMRFPGQRDLTAYASVLRAVALGANRLSEISGRLGQRTQTIESRLRVLQQYRLVRRVPDAFRENRDTYRLAVPLARVWFGCIEPALADLDAGLPIDAELTDRRYKTQVLGPAFEDFCRRWTALQSKIERVAPADLGGEIDIVGLGRKEDGKPSIVVIGEAKARTKPVDTNVLRRLDQAKAFLPKNYDTSNVTLAIYSISGFAPQLEAEATLRHDVRLVNLTDMYHKHSTDKF